MGAVRCQIHGHQIGGPLTCRHIAADIWAATPTRPFQNFKGDLFDDGVAVFDLALCVSCVTELSPPTTGALEARRCEKADPMPVCLLCWREFSAERSVRPGPV